MGKPVVGLDIDGVLANWDEVAHPVYCKHLGLNPLMECVYYDLRKRYGISSERFAEVHPLVQQECDPTTLPMVDGACEALKQLSAMFLLVLVTARHAGIHEVTRQWVARHLEPTTGPVEIYFTGAVNNTYPVDLPLITKLDTCHDLGAVCLVEDNPHEIAALAGSDVEPVCIAWPSNKCLIATHPHIMRGDWPTIAAYLLDKYGAAK